MTPNPDRNGQPLLPLGQARGSSDRREVDVELWKRPLQCGHRVPPTFTAPLVRESIRLTVRMNELTVFAKPPKAAETAASRRSLRVGERRKCGCVHNAVYGIPDPIRAPCEEGGYRFRADRLCAKALTD